MINSEIYRWITWPGIWQSTLKICFGFQKNCLVALFIVFNVFIVKNESEIYKTNSKSFPSIFQTRPGPWTPVHVRPALIRSGPHKVVVVVLREVWQCANFSDFSGEFGALLTILLTGNSSLYEGEDGNGLLLLGDDWGPGFRIFDGDSALQLLLLPCYF